MAGPKRPIWRADWRALRQITLDSNISRETRSGSQAAWHTGVSIGPQSDYITCEPNSFSGRLKQTILDSSKSLQNKLAQAGAPIVAAGGKHQTVG
jgi:hypothetical protein